MRCVLCNHPQALNIHAALAAGTPYREVARQFSLSIHEIHAHLQAHAAQSPPATPLDAARRFLQAALATGHARQVLPATRLFLHCQAQADRHADPLTEEHRLRDADLRHKLLTEREHAHKLQLSKEFELQALVRLLRAHPELFDEWDGYTEAIRREAA